MFGPDLDAYESKLRNEGRSLAVGLWSFLFTGRKEDDRQFFDLYAEYVDKRAGEDWHCIGFAKSVEPEGANDRGWRGDEQRHVLSQEIRQRIRNNLVTPYATAIVFFNPFNFMHECRGIYIPIDGTKLYVEDHMKRGLDMITQAVRESRGADVDDVQTEYGIDNRLYSLQRSLIRQGIRGVAAKFIDRAIGPALGHLFALPILGF